MYKLGDSVQINTLGGAAILGTVIGLPLQSNTYKGCCLIGWKQLEGRGFTGAWLICDGIHFLGATDLLQEVSDRWLKGKEKENPYTYAYWMNEVSLTPIKGSVEKRSNGINCNRCHNHFPYAEPNQPDGTLICWSCKRYPFYK